MHRKAFRATPFDLQQSQLMSDANDKDPKAAANAPVQTESAAPGWLAILIGAAAVALIGCFGYYAFRYVSSSTFNDERAFRVLGEITGQFENLQTTMVSLLSLVPEKANQENIRTRYLESLDIPGLELVQVNPEQTLAQKDICDLHGNSRNVEAQFEVSLADPERSFAIKRCLTVGRNAGSTESDSISKPDATSDHASELFELRGSLARHLPVFAAQGFFDEAVIAVGTGDVLAKIPNGRRATATVELHDARADGLIIADASSLLRHAATAEEVDDSSGVKKDSAAKQNAMSALPSHPVVFDDRIAGENYRVFVVAFTPRNAMNVTPAGDAGAAIHKFYLIGVKHQNLTQQITNSLGPEGTLGITLLVLLAILAWPLLSLRFSPAQDPISCFQMLAVIVSVLLIPMVLTICGYWAWSYLQLNAWADRGAEIYGRDIESALIGELSQDTQLLQTYAQDLRRDGLIVDVAHDLCATRRTALHPLSEQHLTDALRDWLPLHNVAALGPRGTSCGTLRNLFSPAEAQKDWLDLHDREYFEALQQQQQWRPDKLWARLQHVAPDNGFVAQRLFNRSDGARVLQVAVPAKIDASHTGSVTSDTRVYALTAGVAPPLLRFAVVNLSNGAVLFHSDDDRSLAENLLAETEQNEDLSAAMHRRSSLHTLDQVTAEDHFSGRYLGEAHHFYYRPVAGVPWGIVVFYPTADLGTISLQSAVASLATCVLFLVVILLPVLIVLLALPGRPDLDLLAFLWPKWEWRERYVRFTRVGTLMLLALSLLMLALLSSHAIRTISLLLAVGCIAGAIFYIIVRTKTHQTSVQRYQITYIWSFMLVIGGCSVLPSLWLAATYHDVSVRAYLRSELAEAAADIDERHAIIARDLQRWIPDDKQRSDHYPDPWNLSSLLPAPAFHSDSKSNSSRCTAWTLSAFGRMPWVNEEGPRALGLIRRTIWTAATQSNAQRTRRQAASVQRNRPVPAPVSGSNMENTGDDTDPQCKGNADTVAYWLRSNDGTLIKTQASYINEDTHTPQVDADLLRWDSFRKQMTIAATSAGMLLVVILMAWMVARRLFGIRTPFAGRFVAPASGRMAVAPLLDAELALIDLAKQHPGEFTDKDAADWRAVHCEAQYETMWKSLRQEEQLLLHQLAKGHFANPENQSVIERLLHLGFLKLKPWPRISDSGFAHYARTAETEQKFAAWQKEASKNLWNRIRAPLLIVVLVIAALMMWLAGSTMQILSATLAGIATLFGYITQVTNLVRKDNKPPNI
jgi:hypothetical protein